VFGGGLGWFDRTSKQEEGSVLKTGCEGSIEVLQAVETEYKEDKKVGGPVLGGLKNRDKKKIKKKVS